MTKLSSEIKINAPAQQVWAALADLERVQQFSPGVAKASYTTDSKEGVGAGRHCDLQGPSGWVEERVTEWNEGESLTIEIFDSSYPLKQAFGRFTLTPAGEETNVSFDLDYELKFGPIGALLNVLIVRRLFGKANKTVLTGLKYHVETGEVVDKEIPSAASSAASA